MNRSDNEISEKIELFCLDCIIPRILAEMQDGFIKAQKAKVTFLFGCEREKAAGQKACRPRGDVSYDILIFATIHPLDY